MYFEQRLRDAIEDELNNREIYLPPEKIDLVANQIIVKLAVWLAKTAVSMSLTDINRFLEILENIEHGGG